MSMSQLAQGYHFGLPVHAYLSDPCPEPSLSTGIVQALFDQTPAHAWQKHPKLGGQSSEQTSRGDIGSAVHELTRGAKTVAFAPAEFEDWRKKAAQEFRDTARSQGLLPLLEWQREQVERAAENSRKALDTLGKGASEVTMLWKSGGVWCRGRADWLDDGRKYDVDLKTVSSADAAAFVRGSVYQNGYDVQAGLRHLGHLAISGRPREMLWLLQEIEPPYATRFVGVGVNMLVLAEKKTMHAAKLWRRCLDGKSWPAYDNNIVWAEPTTTAIWDAESRGVQL